MSPSELIYIPSDDPYFLGKGGRLLEDEHRSIHITFVFDTGDEVSVAVRKGRITNILVEPENVDFAKELSSLGSPFSVFSPGLAGVARTESYVSDGVLLRTLARGDANLVLRNILYRLKKRPAEWASFEDDLSSIFPGYSLNVNFDQDVDQHINVTLDGGISAIPLDLAGTGFLQAIQILAYLHLFQPKLIILDEPDSHLHPNNQRLLCSLLEAIAAERSVQVLITTHSRHVLDAMYQDSRILWVQDGDVKAARPEDQVELLLELGALDIKEKVNSGKYKVIFLTEDKESSMLRIILENCGFLNNITAVLPYNGVVSINLLKPLVRQISNTSNAKIFVHRDRDYLDPDEVEKWKKDIRELGAEPFVTSEMDVEGYFCTKDYLSTALKGKGIDVDVLYDKIPAEEYDETLISFINGRIDHERKTGTIGKIDHGKLAAAAAKKVSSDVGSFMKGKRKISKIRHILQNEYKIGFYIDKNLGIPTDFLLIEAAKKYMT